VDEYNLYVLEYNENLKKYDKCSDQMDDYLEKAMGYYTKENYTKSLEYYNNLFEL